MASEDLAATLQRSKKEPETFVSFYTALFDEVLAFVMRRVDDAEVALDLTAEAFAQAYVARKRFRGSTELEARAWLYRIAKRQLSRYLRRGRLEIRALQRLGIEVPSITDEEISRIERLADLEGLRACLREEIARLTPAQQDALRLRVVDELPYAVIAAQLRITEQAARLRVSRALNALAETLEDHPTIKEAM